MAVVQNRIRLAELRLFLFQVFLLARFQGQTIQFFHLIPQKLEFGLCFIGILLALPVAAAVAVVLRHTKQRWLASSWYHGGTDGDPMPEAPDDDAPRRDTDSAAP